MGGNTSETPGSGRMGRRSALTRLPAFPDVFHPSTWLQDNHPLSPRGHLCRAGRYLRRLAESQGGLGRIAPGVHVRRPIGRGGGRGCRRSGAADDRAATRSSGVPGPPGGAPTPQPYNIAQTGEEAAGAGVGQLAAGGLLRFRPGYNPLGANPLDVRALRDPAVQQRAADAYARAQGQGVQITPGQASGLPSLLNTEDVFASGSAGGEGANVARRYYEGQRNQLTAAFDQGAGGISPAADKTDAALQFQQGAEDAQRIIRQQANAAARPSYQAAQAGGMATASCRPIWRYCTASSPVRTR